MFLWSVPKDPNSFISLFQCLYHQSVFLMFNNPTVENHCSFSTIAFANRLVHSRLLHLWTILSCTKSFPPLLHDILTLFPPVLDWDQFPRPPINLIWFISSWSTFFLKCRILNWPGHNWGPPSADCSSIGIISCTLQSILILTHPAVMTEGFCNSASLIYLLSNITPDPFLQNYYPLHPATR